MKIICSYMESSIPIKYESFFDQIYLTQGWDIPDQSGPRMKCNKGVLHTSWNFFHTVQRIRILFEHIYLTHR